MADIAMQKECKCPRNERGDRSLRASIAYIDREQFAGCGALLIGLLSGSEGIDSALGSLSVVARFILVIFACTSRPREETFHDLVVRR